MLGGIQYQSEHHAVTIVAERTFSKAKRISLGDVLANVSATNASASLDVGGLL